MKGKICKRIIYFFMSLIIILSSVNIPVYASATLASILSTIGYSALATGTASITSHLIDGWLGDDRAYYDAQGSNPTYDYSSNNQSFGSLTNSGTNNEHCYNTYNSSTTNNRVKSIVKNSFNTTTNKYDTKIYCPITNTYETTNNISYNYDYDTYFIQNNEYNYYVTNNYTYVSYYIVNNYTGEDDYYEIYYEMPDGRNSYDLEPSDIWGEYFIYDVVNYDSYKEDDGKTLALYHLDGNAKDSSYCQNSDLTLGNGIFADGKFNLGLSLSSPYQVFLPLPDSFDINNFTLEFSFIYSGSDSFFGRFGIFDHIAYSDEMSSIYYDHRVHYNQCEIGYIYPGVYHFVVQCDDGFYSAYINGQRCGKPELDYNNILQPSSLYCRYTDSVYVPSTVVLDKSASNKLFYFYNNGIYFGNPDTSSVEKKIILDEVRLSNCSLYSGNVISVPSQSFDTNEVLVLPSEPYESLIAVQGRYAIENYRIGGVRPTYPALGDVYIYLEDDKVVDIQQYEGDAWYSVNGAIYKDGEWHDLIKYDLSSYYADEDEDTGGIDDGVTDKEPSTEEPSTEEPSTEEPSTEEPSTEEPSTGDLPSGGDNIDITVSGNGTGSGGSSGGGLSGLLDGVSGFFDGIFAIVGKLLEYLGKGLDLLTGVVEKVLNLVPKNITNLLVGIFPFIPKEWVVAIELSIVLGVVIGIVGIFKK